MRLVRDVETARQLHKHVGFYNGIGAGASFQGIFIFNFFKGIQKLPSFLLKRDLLKPEQRIVAGQNS